MLVCVIIYLSTPVCMCTFVHIHIICISYGFFFIHCVCIRTSFCATQTAKKDLLTLDFEGILNYFRVSLPKRFQTEQQCQHLFHALRGFKVCPFISVIISAYIEQFCVVHTFTCMWYKSIKGYYFEPVSV